MKNIKSTNFSVLVHTYSFIPLVILAVPIRYFCPFCMIVLCSEYNCKNNYENLQDKLRNQAQFLQHKLNIEYDTFLQISITISRKIQKSSMKSMETFGYLEVVETMLNIFNFSKSVVLITCDYSHSTKML